MIISRELELVLTSKEGGKYPNVIVEILSDSTANIDRTKKKILYQNTFRTPNYFWFDPESLERITLTRSEYGGSNQDYEFSAIALRQ